MLTRSREAPSVASTRILKTHRMNEVETFRLQGKLKTINTESKQNYSQISDEIAGVRKNLTKIKDIPISHGISVERRKLLHEQGMRILPPGRGSETTWKVKTADGQEFAFENMEFYDGASLRRKISSTSQPPNPHCTSIAPPEEVKEAIEKEERHSASKPFPYRVITPPHRPGSRQNFKVVERNGSSDEEEERARKGLEGYGRRRAHTARLVRRQGTRFLLRPRSNTCPNVQDDKGEPASKTSVLSVQRSSSCGPLMESKNEWDASSQGLPTNQENSTKGQSRERAISSGDLKLRRNSNVPRQSSVQTESLSSGATDVVHLTRHAQKLEIDNEQTSATRSSAKVAWAVNDRHPERRLSEPRSSILQGPVENTSQHGRNVGSVNSNKALPNQGKRRYYTREADGQVVKEQNITGSRRGRELKKDFITMQMTIGNKQIKVHIPKFNSDLGEDIVDRARGGRQRKTSVSWRKVHLLMGHKVLSRDQCHSRVCTELKRFSETVAWQNILPWFLDTIPFDVTAQHLLMLTRVVSNFMRNTVLLKFREIVFQGSKGFPTFSGGAFPPNPLQTGTIQESVLRATRAKSCIHLCFLRENDSEHISLAIFPLRERSRKP